MAMDSPLFSVVPDRTGRWGVRAVKEPGGMILVQDRMKLSMSQCHVAPLGLELHAASQTEAPEIKMVVGEWYTDELGNRTRVIYNASPEVLAA
jgi:hypothetical protein